MGTLLLCAADIEVLRDAKAGHVQHGGTIVRAVRGKQSRGVTVEAVRMMKAGLLHQTVAGQYLLTAAGEIEFAAALRRERAAAVAGTRTPRWART